METRLNQLDPLRETPLTSRPRAGIAEVGGSCVTLSSRFERPASPDLIRRDRRFRDAEEPGGDLPKVAADDLNGSPVKSADRNSKKVQVGSGVQPRVDVENRFESWSVCRPTPQ